MHVPRWLRSALAFLIVLVGLALLWEGYKAMGKATGGLIPFTNVKLPVRPDDSAMPHVADIFGALFKPVSRARNADLLIVLLAKNALVTWHRAAVGFLMGSLAGFGLGALFARSRLLERGLMPFVVASQTIPLIAIAPMIVIWGGSGAWPSWLVHAFFLDEAGFSVAVISAYLTFFPVTINSLRGLRSPDPTAVDLMRSYAASEGQILWKLRLPASLPYLFTALKISATASVIGAIIGELPRPGEALRDDHHLRRAGNRLRGAGGPGGTGRHQPWAHEAGRGRLGGGGGGGRRTRGLTPACSMQRAASPLLATGYP